MKDLEGLPTIHYSQMPEPPADSPTYREVKAFHRELPRLLAEGNEGKWALIKGDEIVGLYDTLDEGHRAGLDRFQFQPCILQPVREWQPVLRMRF